MTKIKHMGVEIELKDCELENLFQQCCCTCVYHLEDMHYCGHKDVLTPLPIRQGEGCVCNIRKGWVCAPPEFEGRVHSGWPEHSGGCELHTRAHELNHQPVTKGSDGTLFNLPDRGRPE